MDLRKKLGTRSNTGNSSDSNGENAQLPDGGYKYLDPNARIKERRTVTLDALKISKDTRERYHHSQSRSSVNFRGCAIFDVR